MKTKIETLRDLEFYGSYEYCLDTCKKWLDLKPDNPELKQMAQELSSIFFYVTYMQQNERHYKLALQEFRQDKLRAVQRARKSEKENEELKKEINKLKNLTGL